jgi:hypothetical protein
MRISGVTWSNSVPPIQKPSPQPSPGLGRVEAAAVDQQLGAFLLAQAM